MTVVSSNFSALMAPGLKAIFDQRYNQVPAQYSQIFNEDTSTRQFEVTQGVTGFGLVPYKPEGKGIQYDDPIQGFNRTYIHSTFALGFRVTREAYEDELYGVFKKSSKGLAKSASVTREILGANIFNNGFGDVGPDGVSLFNSAHPLVAGGFYGNRPTTPVALSQTAIEQALTSFRKTVDDRGQLIMLRPKTLVVPPELEFQAREYIQSALKPDSQNNNINPIMSSLDVQVWDWLTNPTAWFIVADKEDQNLRWFNRRPVSFDNADDFDTKDAKFSVDWRSSAGYDDFRGVYGSPGS
jgi:phage major head subunit gpT-like protein